MKIQSPHRTKSFLYAAAALTPVLLCLLFEGLKHEQALMDRWVFGAVAPFEQFWGRFWGLVPISMMEVSIALALIGSAGWLLRALVLLVRSRAPRPFFLRLGTLLTLWLWVLAGFNWLWNATYYASSFSQRAGLESAPYSVETLAGVTEHFATQAASLSAQIKRDSGGHFAESIEDCFARGPETYRNISVEFPCLSIQSVKAKPIFCSRLQSILGFTGMYFPFTGEANVNVDAPACLIPATITHEMAHQRLVASELEANFIGITAAVTCGNPVFQYSGYLMGLIQLSNALYPVAPDLWYEIVNRTFTPELARDWADNYEYWQALASPVEDAAEQVYDSFLKQNDQELGMRSYGACVDLLVAYFS